MGQKGRRGEGGSLSPINIISIGAQNGLCQQNTGLLSVGEHEDERDAGEEREERQSESGFYMEHLIYHLLL